MTDVLIVDDEEDIIRLIRAIVETTQPGFTVVGEATTGADAVEQWRATRPDVIVLDQRLPDMWGLDVARMILEEQPDQSIFLFCAYLDEGTVNRAAKLGVRACISKADVSSLPNALERLAS